MKDQKTQFTTRIEEELKDEIVETVNNFKKIYSEISQNLVMTLIIKAGLEKINENLKNNNYSKAELKYLKFSDEINKEEIEKFFNEIKNGNGYQKAGENIGISKSKSIKFYFFLKDLGNIEIVSRETKIINENLDLEFIK